MLTGLPAVALNLEPIITPPDCHAEELPILVLPKVSSDATERLIIVDDINATEIKSAIAAIVFCFSS